MAVSSGGYDSHTLNHARRVGVLCIFIERMMDIRDVFKGSNESEISQVVVKGCKARYKPFFKRRDNKMDRK